MKQLNNQTRKNNMGIGRWFPALLEQSKRFLIFHSRNIFFYRHHFKDVIDQLDVRIILRVPHDVLKRRRHDYHIAGKGFLSCRFFRISSLRKPN